MARARRALSRTGLLTRRDGTAIRLSMGSGEGWVTGLETSYAWVTGLETRPTDYRPSHPARLRTDRHHTLYAFAQLAHGNRLYHDDEILAFRHSARPGGLIGAENYNSVPG